MSSGNPSVELAPLRGSIEINLDALEELEESINNLKGDLTDLSSSIEFTSNIDTLVDQLHELTDGLGDLTEHLTISSNIDDILNQLDSLKDDVTNLDANITFSTNIDGLIDEIDSIKDSLTDIDTTITVTSNIGDVIKEINSLHSDLEDLTGNIDFTSNIPFIMEEIESIRENTHDIDATITIESNISEVLGQVNELKRALEDSFNIDVNGNIGSFESKLDSVTETMQGLQNMSEEEIEFLKSLGATVEELEERLDGLGSSAAATSDDMARSFEESISSADDLRGTLSRLEITLGSLKYMSDIKGNLTVEGITSTLGELDELQGTIANVIRSADDLNSTCDITDEEFDEIKSRAEEASSSIFDLQEKVSGLGERSEITGHDTEDFGDRMLESGQNALWNGQMISSMMSPIRTVGEEMFELGLKTSSALVVSNHMFGSNAAQVDNWSKGTVNSMGLAQGAALTTALQFGMSARTLGANKFQAAGLAEGYTQLAQHINLGTQGSISYQQAAQACLQAMAGQTYGLKALGISFSTSNENAEAAALGYGKAYKSLDPVQQATVRLKLAEKELNKEFGTTGQDLDTNYGKWEKTKAQLEQTGESIGEQLVPMVLKVAKDIGKLATKFEHLSKPAKDTVLAIGGIMLIAGPVVEAFGLIKLAIGGAKKAFELFEAIMDTDPIILAITALIGAVVLMHEAWVHNWGGIRTETEKVWKDIVQKFEWGKTHIGTVLKDIAMVIAGFANPVIGVSELIYEAWTHNFMGIKTNVEHAWNEIVSKTKHQLQNIKNDSKKCWDDLTNGWHHMTNKISNTVTTWWDKQKTSWENGYNSLKHSAESWWNHQKTMYDDEVQKITNTWDKCKAETLKGWHDIKSMVSTGMHDVKTKITTGLHDVLSAIERTPFVQQVAKIAHSIEHLGNACKNAVVDIAKALAHAVIERLEDLGEEIEQKVYHITQDFSKAWQDIKNSTENTMSDVKNIFEQKWNDLCDWFDEYVGKPAEKAEQMLDKFTRYISNGMETAQQDFDSKWNALCNWFAVHVDRPAEHVAAMFSQFVSYVGSGIQSAENRFVSGWDSLCGWFSGHVNRISSAVSQTFNRFTSLVESGIQSARSRFENGWSSLCGWFSGHVNSIVSNVSQMFSQFTSLVGSGIESAGSRFESGWNSLCGWFSGASQRVVSDVRNLGGEMTSAGEEIIDDLMSGIQNRWYAVTNWVANEINGLANKVTSEASHIVGDITHWGNDGSHATGLTYVPWDGYRAELHKGEMVLTAEQAENYNKGGIGGNTGNIYSFYSPEPIDPFEAKRQMVDASRKLANGFY